MSKIKLKTLAFLDVETTGLSPFYNDRICEIAILLQHKNELTHWHSLINPERPISCGASAVNSITDDMIRNAPKFSEVARKIIDLIEGTIIVCHNATFDISFVSMELSKCGLSMPNLFVIDTLKIARKYFNFPSNSLPSIAEYLGIDNKRKHRALADVYTTQKVFSYFYKELSIKDTNDAESMLFLGMNNSKDLYKSKRINLHPILEEAIGSDILIQMRYRSKTGIETQRIIKPLEIVNSFDYLYLLAFCHTKKEKRTFRLDRIINISKI